MHCLDQLPVMYFPGRLFLQYMLFWSIVWVDVQWDHTVEYYCRMVWSLPKCPHTKESNKAKNVVLTHTTWLKAMVHFSMGSSRQIHLSAKQNQTVQSHCAIMCVCVRAYTCARVCMCLQLSLFCNVIIPAWCISLSLYHVLITIIWSAVYPQDWLQWGDCLAPT